MSWPHDGEQKFYGLLPWYDPTCAVLIESLWTRLSGERRFRRPLPPPKCAFLDISSRALNRINWSELPRLVSCQLSPDCTRRALQVSGADRKVCVLPAEQTLLHAALREVPDSRRVVPS